VGERAAGGEGFAGRLGIVSKWECVDEDFEGGDGSIIVFAETGLKKGRIGRLLKD
jgi:hypothetical protein